MGSALLVAKRLFAAKPPKPEPMSRADFYAELVALKDQIHAGHLAILEKLDANHRELLAALDRQVTRINALESALARVDEAHQELTMQPLSYGKDAFHRVPNSPQKRIAICHLPFAITGSACLRPLRLCGPCVRILTWQLSLQNSVPAKWPTPPSPLPFLCGHRVSAVPLCASRISRHRSKEPDSQERLPSPQSIFGARNLAGVAGHARRSNKKTTKERKIVIV
jgi:hypothetical protein